MTERSRRRDPGHTPGAPERAALAAEVGLRPAQLLAAEDASESVARQALAEGVPLEQALALGAEAGLALIRAALTN